MNIKKLLPGHSPSTFSITYTMSMPGHWYYESDGDEHSRTFYTWRYNSAVKGGIERKDFSSRAQAMKFLDDNETY